MQTENHSITQLVPMKRTWTACTWRSYDFFHYKLFTTWTRNTNKPDRYTTEYSTKTKDRYP